MQFLLDNILQNIFYMQLSFRFKQPNLDGQYLQFFYYFKEFHAFMDDVFRITV